VATGPHNQKRPADVIGCAVAVARLSVGDHTEALTVPSGRVRSGRAGGRARAARLTVDQKSEIAKKAANTRWQ
jgi:hypothetical protein